MVILHSRIYSFTLAPVVGNGVNALHRPSSSLTVVPSKNGTPHVVGYLTSSSLGCSLQKSMANTYPDPSVTPFSDTSTIPSTTASSTTTAESGLHNHRMCKCQCGPSCNCSCTCRDHCICLSKHGDNHTRNEDCSQDCKYKCRGECGSRKGYRNLVVCLDGTSNQFGHRVCIPIRHLSSLLTHSFRIPTSWSCIIVY